MNKEFFPTKYDVERRFIEVITTNWYKFKQISDTEDLLKILGKN